MEDPAEAGSTIKNVVMFFWLTGSMLTIACLVSILILIGLEYRELIDLLSHDYKMFIGLFRKPDKDNEEPVQYVSHRKRSVETTVQKP